MKDQRSQQHVVFMDMDVLVLDSILEIFCSDYGYGLTINANEYDPIDIGLQFVQATHYDEGIAFLKVGSTAAVASLATIFNIVTTTVVSHVANLVRTGLLLSRLLSFQGSQDFWICHSINGGSCSAANLTPGGCDGADFRCRN